MRRLPIKTTLPETANAPLEQKTLWRAVRDGVLARLRQTYKDPAIVQDAKGKNIIVSYGGLKHALHHGVPSLEESVLALHIQEAIHHAEEGVTVADHSGRDDPKSVTRYHVDVAFDGVLRRVDIVVRNHSDGTRYYDHAVAEKESPAGLPESGSAALQPNAPAPPFTGLAISIAEVVSGRNVHRTAGRA